MIKEFKIDEDFDTIKASQQVKKMKKILEKLASNEIPNESTYTKSDLTNFCKSLITNQRNDLKSIKPGSWCIVPTEVVEEGMPSDARVDFIYFPTYIAISILTRVLIDYPEIAQQIPNYEEVLKKGYKFSTYRKLSGHGYDADLEMIEAIRILSMGKVPEFLASNPEFSPELFKVLKEIKRRLEISIRNGRTRGPWGQDYSEGFKEVIRMLKPLDVRDRRNPRIGPNDELIRAARNGNLKKVKLLIQNGADINAKDNIGRTALIYAARVGHLKVAKLLIDKGVDVNAKDNYGWTALMHAAINGHPEVVKLLIDKGANINAKNDYGRTAFDYAYAKEKRYAEIVNLLKAHETKE